uniref:Peroxisome assembly protein 12 n=1 Tax=Timema monikensis TaxID=170555 RepID=A0A7R9HML0_9NEOP|nr:unnamed protein product [Timema monikensis]
MNNQAVYLTQNNQPTPSIFEVIAQETFNDLLSPAFKQVSMHLASCYPELFGWLGAWHEEIFLALNIAVQYTYLKNVEASYSEFLYSLKRSCVKGEEAPLSRRHLFGSLALLTVFPYLRSRLHSLATRYCLDEGDGVGPSDTRRKTLRRVVMCLSTLLGVTLESWKLCQTVLYLLGKSTTHSPLLLLLGLTLRYCSEQQSEFYIWKVLFWGRIPMFLNKTLERLSNHWVEVVGFLTQLVQSVSSNQNARAIAKGDIPAPRAFPKPSNVCGDGFICPLCLKKPKVPTVLRVSGYIFCYLCIINHLIKSETCPVTKYAASTEDLIRLNLT